MEQAQPSEKKTILILKSNPLSLQSAEQFLRAREWNIITTTNLADAIQTLFTSKIDYFLLCANHSHKKVKVLPKVLMQFSTLKLITYTDIASTFNMSILNEMGVPYQIVPPVSGPSIERIIFRIEKEVAQRLTDGNRDNTTNQGQAQGKILDESLREKFNMFLGPDADEFANKFDDKKGPTFIRKDPLSPAAGGFMGLQGSSLLENDQSEDSATNPSKTNKASSGSSSPEAFVTKKAFTNENLPRQRFQEGIETVLESTVEKGEKPTPIRRIGSTQNCVCLSINSPALRGFLVAAMGHHRRFDDELLMHIQGRLVELFKEEGIPLYEDEPLEVKIKQVNFEQWAIEKADFLKKSIHHGNEVAMAFFKTEKLTPRFGEAESSDMVTIEIDDLVTENQVSFDVYVYLPANDRYILYTPKGGIFLQAQKDRLKSKGIEKMHIKKEETLEARRYHMQVTLNSSIQEFQAETQETDAANDDDTVDKLKKNG